MAPIAKKRLRIKRVYEPPSSEDGQRVLIDRIWPRGSVKADAKIDEWLKDVAPSKELRQWFGHDPEKWTDFRKRYWKELDEREAAQEALQALSDKLKKGPVTLLFAARDTEHNHAIALRDRLLRAKK